MSTNTDYDTEIEVSAGETFRHDTDQDGDLTDTLIDITAPGAKYDILLHSPNTIENVGVRGSLPAKKESCFHIKIEDEDATAYVRNVYLGDGGEDGQTGIFTSRHHGGTVEIENCTVGNFADNLWYCSSPGNRLIDKNASANGTVILRDCFGYNGTSSGIRLGTPSSKAIGCVIDDEHEDNPLVDASDGGGYTSRNHTDRGIWAYSGSPEYEDCRVRIDGEGMVAAVNSRYYYENEGATSEVTLRNLLYTGGPLQEYPGGEINYDDVEEDPDADYSPPGGCPLSPEAAASGSGGTSRPDYIHRLVIDGSKVADTVEYELVGHASRVDPGDDANVGDGEERIDKRTWEGLVEGGQDDFLIDSKFDPHLTSLELRGPADDIERVVVLLNGTDVSTADAVTRIPTDDEGDQGDQGDQGNQDEEDHSC